MEHLWIASIQPVELPPPNIQFALQHWATVSAGIKQQHFRRFCSSKNRPSGGDAVRTLHEFLNCLACSDEPLDNGAPWHARTGSWENGPAAIARKHFSHPSFSLLRLLAAIQPASGDAVTITIGGRSPPIRCIGRGAGIARSNGARSIRATGSNCASTIPRGRNETGSANGKGTSDGDNAVLPTTTQLRILPTTAQLSRKSLNQKRRILLANNSPLVKGRLLPHKGKRLRPTDADARRPHGDDDRVEGRRATPDGFRHSETDERQRERGAGDAVLLHGNPRRTGPRTPDASP